MKRLLTATLLPASFLATASHASTVVIWPVDPILKPGEQATALWLENKGDKPVTLQVRSFDWAQPQGDDALTPQNDVVVSPPIAVVPAGKRQLVRIIRRDPAAAAAPERAFRLLIDEVPTQPAAGDPAAASARLAVQMRYSIPLFTYTADPGAQKVALVARTIATGDGRVVEIRNTGTLHARLTDLRVVLGNQERMIKAGLSGYVLPGATVRFVIPGDAAGVVKVGVNGVDQTLEPAT
ncbi:molecular chaperone [Sphingomonas panacisoli]|nr:molecular chaperone [Sphingomonas panacisoli]